MAQAATASGASAHSPSTNNFSMAKIILAASAGTMIEWYDFYIFGSLTGVIAVYFFGTADANKSILLWLAAYATGFLVRPFGALVFGRIGDIIGRKYTFLVTMTIMGLSTAAIGLIPISVEKGAAISIIPPLILVALRLLQGLALGGEYGGAATYIAEHAPEHRRGYYTSFIQITATAGFFLSLIVILLTRQALSGPSSVTLAQGKTAFEEWGWRVPFLLSLVLVAISHYIRISLRESPLFQRLKDSGKTSKNPLVESFGNPVNRRLVILALFGATAGQGVVWYTGQFYALVFLQTFLKLDLGTSYVIVAIALVLGAPFFVVMGQLSDRIGRKKIILAGCLLAAIAYVPIYMLMTSFGPYGFNANGVIDTTVANPTYSPVMLVVLIWVQVLFVTMVYGPIAAFLVELFPTKIRYTSMSLPYHLGNGWFGGLLPVIATFLITSFAPKIVDGAVVTPSPFGTGYIYTWLVFPIVVALITVFVGSRYLKENMNRDLSAESSDTEASTGAPVPVPGR